MQKKEAQEGSIIGYECSTHEVIIGCSEKCAGGEVIEKVECFGCLNEDDCDRVFDEIISIPCEEC